MYMQNSVTENFTLLYSLLKTFLGACILRIPVLYGPVENLNESAVTCLLSVLKSKQPQNVSHYEKRSPAHVSDIAHILRDMISLLVKVSLNVLTSCWLVNSADPHLFRKYPYTISCLCVGAV